MCLAASPRGHVVTVHIYDAILAGFYNCLVRVSTSADFDCMTVVNGLLEY